MPIPEQITADLRQITAILLQNKADLWEIMPVLEQIVSDLRPITPDLEQNRHDLLLRSRVMSHLSHEKFCHGPVKLHFLRWGDNDAP